MLTLRPIPPEAGKYQGWETVAITASDEPLVEVTSQGVHAHPIYHHRYQSDATILLRASAVERLKYAQSLLPSGVQLIVVDGYRSLSLQQQLYDQYFDAFRAQYPNKNDEEVAAITVRYVRLPTLSLQSPSPHLTGGAVDVMLKRDGEWLFAGTEHDDMTPASSLMYYENRELVDQREITARNTRRLLYAVMSEAGFAGYEPEWWHFNTPETQMGAANLGLADASFGPIFEG